MEENKATKKRHRVRTTDTFLKCYTNKSNGESKKKKPRKLKKESSAEKPFYRENCFICERSN